MIFGVPLIATFLLVLAGCDSAPGRPRREDMPILPNQVKDFAVLWSENCRGCHGADGTLGAARPMNDPIYLAVVSDVELESVIAQGVAETAMPAFALSHGGTLTDEQIDIVAREMRARWGKPDALGGASAPPYRASKVGDATRGALGYAKFCARCHGADGTGGDAPGSIIDPSYLALVSDQALRSAVLFGRIDLGMPDWRGYVPGQPMSDQEINDVVAWLRAGRS